MSNPKEIPTADRIMALLSPPSQDVYLTVEDARWIKDEIERLRAVINECGEDALSYERLEEIGRLQAENERLRQIIDERIPDQGSQIKRLQAKVERLETVVEAADTLVKAEGWQIDKYELWEQLETALAALQESNDE